MQWCIFTAGASKVDFCFSLLQTLVSYHAFAEGISKLKQITGHNHCLIQHYIVSVIAGSVPRRFLLAICTLLDFQYLAQALSFTDYSLTNLAKSLQEFHDHKDGIMHAGAQKDSWVIPKLELLQNVIPSICLSGSVIQWSADITEHAHIQEIKVPAHARNNQNYYSQIARYLDHSEKCFHFDLATYLQSQANSVNQDNDEVFDRDDEHEPDSEESSLAEHMTTVQSTNNYFTIAEALHHGSIPMAVKPFCTFSTSTTTFHLATKPSLRLNIDETATMFNLPDLCQALFKYLHHLEHGAPHTVSGARSMEQNCTLPFDHLQVWHKLQVQQMQFYNNELPDVPQTLHALPPSPSCSHGLYDAVVINADGQSDWPQCGLDGTSAILSIYYSAD